jgi:hypothetical protein
MMNVNARTCLVVAALAVVVPAAASGAPFPIADDAADEESQSIAFDGTNFLVAVQGGGVRAEIVNPSGTVIASVNVPRSGDPARVAFDGTNYLLVWREPTNPGGQLIYGQLVSKLAVAVGTPFLVSQSTTTAELEGVAFDGTRYLVVWTNNRVADSAHDIFGRFVSTAGAPEDSDLEIDDGAGRDARVAFGEGRYLVIWTEDTARTETRGRFIVPNGAFASGGFTVNGSLTSSANPGALGFDGTNFLAVWTDEVGLGNWDFFGQRVSPAGALVGTPIPITTAPGQQLLPYVAFDGVNYLVTWTDLANDTNGNFACESGEGTCVDIYGQLVSPSGSLVGVNFAVTTRPGSQGQSPVAYGGGKYLVAWIDGLGTDNEDVLGIFVSLGSPHGVDWDSDARADHTVYNPPSGLWYGRSSVTGGTQSTGFGGNGYEPVPGDYDGDMSSDTAVYHPASGLWFVRPSSTGNTEVLGFGGPGYLPVRGDFDGDRKSDVAMYHPPSGLWFIRQSTTASTVTQGYGGPEYTAVPGDYDGDGKADLAAFHASSGLWFLRSSATGTTTVVGFGGPGYAPVRGDFDGDRKSDVAAYHPPTGLWFIRQSTTGTTQSLGLGGSGYDPVAADYDGDGRMDVAVYHEASGSWYTRSSATGVVSSLTFGGPGFDPLF